MSKSRDKIGLTLENRIYSGFYWPRQQLVEGKLAEEMNVSRTIIRDVLKGLSLKGLVNIQPHRGAFVAELSFQNMIEILELEAILESSAAYLATPRLNKEKIQELRNLIEDSKKIDPNNIQSWATHNWQFHKIIIAECGNDRLIKMIRDNVRFLKFWFVKLSIPEEITVRNEAHGKIVDAIEKRDALEVRKLIEAHLLFSAEKLLGRIKNSNPNIIAANDNAE